MKYIKEFFFFFNPKIGDILHCKKDCGFNSAYKHLPRIYDFEEGKEYEVIDVTNNSVTIESDQTTTFSDNKATQIFSLDKKNKDFPYIWDFFSK